MGKRQYARGRNAVAECQRSGQKMRYRDLVEDGHISGLLVHPDWWEPKHPQEIPVEVTDPIALWRPAPEISIEDDYGEPEAPLPAPTAPDMGAAATGTTSQSLSGGETFILTTVALRYSIGDWLLVELDTPSTYFVSRIVIGSDSPTFKIPITTEFSGSATAGNNFWINTDGNPWQ